MDLTKKQLEYLEWRVQDGDVYNKYSERVGIYADLHEDVHEGESFAHFKGAKGRWPLEPNYSGPHIVEHPQLRDLVFGVVEIVEDRALVMVVSNRRFKRWFKGAGGSAGYARVPTQYEKDELVGATYTFGRTVLKKAPL